MTQAEYADLFIAKYRLFLLEEDTFPRQQPSFASFH